MKSKSRSPKRPDTTKSEPQSKPLPVELVSYKFAHYQPQAIETMVLSSDGTLMAVARSNCSIEIWLTDTWSQLMTIAGNKNCSIRNLHWAEPVNSDGKPQSYVCDEGNPLYLNLNDGSKIKRRLFSTGLNGVVIEWDLATRSIKEKHSVHAAIWSSQLRGKFLYLACDDGSIKILKIKKEKIELKRTLPKSETRCLSL
jgi:WD40 repeat protein